MSTESSVLILITNSDLYCSCNLAGTQAAGASVYTLRCTVNKCLYSSDIRFPCSVGTSVGVGNLDAESDTLTTVITLCHSLHLLSVTIHSVVPKHAP